MNRNHSPVSLATIRRSVASSTAIETEEDVKDIENMLENLSQEEYNLLLKSGMFWEKCPLASGSYFIDVVEPNQEKKMEIDIRSEREQEVKSIRFSELDTLSLDVDVNYIDIKDTDGNEYSVRMSDVDNMILALQKAKELWSDEC